MAIKRNGGLVHATPLVLENIMLVNKSRLKRTNTIWLHLGGAPRMGKFIETESRLRVSERRRGRGQSDGRKG